MKPHTKSTIAAAAFSPDGKTLVSTHGDHTVKCQNGSCLKVLSGHRRTSWVNENNAPSQPMQPNPDHIGPVTIKAYYREKIFKFWIPRTSGFEDLKIALPERLHIGVDMLQVRYKDIEGDLISIPCDADWELCLSSSLLKTDIIRVYVQVV